MSSDQGQPLSVRLRCKSWEQVAALHRRDLSRWSVFLKSTKPPPIGTRLQISLTLPSESLIILDGKVGVLVPPDGLGGRGPGIDVRLDRIPSSALWMIESALTTAGLPFTKLNQAGPSAGEDPHGAKKPAAPPPLAQESDDSAERSMEEGEHIVAAENDLLSSLEEQLSHLRSLNFFQILDIDYSANDDTVRAAFAELTKKYHPDHFARYESDDARLLASEVFLVIRNAYRALANPQSRQRELSRIRDKAGESTQIPAITIEGNAPANPSDSVRRQTPVQHKPAQEFGGAYALIEKGQYDTALTYFRIAAKKDPANAKARAGVELCEALRARTQGDRMRAAEHFEAVLEADPGNEVALREVSKMKQAVADQRKGFLGRLLGKNS